MRAIHIPEKMPLKAERKRFLDDRDFPATVTITASPARKIRVENLRSRVKTLDRFRRGPDTAVDKVSAERLDHGPARGTLSLRARRRVRIHIQPGREKTLPPHEENTMSKNAMAGAVTLCGVGLCMIGGAMMMQNGQQANAATAVSMPATAAAVTAAASTQAGGEPTVVWYGVADAGATGTNQGLDRLYRAWSDGTIEVRLVYNYVTSGGTCVSAPQCGWTVISSPTEGFRATSDANADEKVDGADLGMLLSNWGDAPRVPFPPSDCPLNLINP
jgi:hypothetical protein